MFEGRLRRPQNQRVDCRNDASIVFEYFLHRNSLYDLHRCILRTGFQGRNVDGSLPASWVLCDNDTVLIQRDVLEHLIYQNGLKQSSKTDE